MAIWGRLCLAWCCVLVSLYYYISESLHLHGNRGKETKNMFGLRGKSVEQRSSGSALLRKTAAGMMPRDHHILHKKCKSDRLSTAMLSEELAEDNVGINGAVLESYRDFLEEGHAPDTQFFEYVANHCDLPRSTAVVVDTDTNETATIADVKVTGVKIFVTGAGEQKSTPKTPEEKRASQDEGWATDTWFEREQNKEGLQKLGITDYEAWSKLSSEERRTLVLRMKKRASNKRKNKRMKNIIKQLHDGQEGRHNTNAQFKGLLRRVEKLIRALNECGVQGVIDALRANGIKANRELVDKKSTSQHDAIQNLEDHISKRTKPGNRQPLAGQAEYKD